MSEGRLADVVLLDDQHLEVLVQSKLYVHELMGMVASHCNLRREKHYFGLSFRDETGHYQWLQLDKHILDHEFPKKSGTITLYFQVKFYIESILLLMERTTVILFYMQSKQLLCKGLIETDCETIFELSAYILQISHGDYQDDTISRNNLKNFQLPRKILEENPSISFCEDQIISFYKRLCGLTSGSAIINYMSIVESLPTYGIHYYGVKEVTCLMDGGWLFIPLKVFVFSFLALSKDLQNKGFLGSLFRSNVSRLAEFCWIDSHFNDAIELFITLSHASFAF